MNAVFNVTVVSALLYKHYIANVKTYYLRIGGTCWSKNCINGYNI